MATGAGPMANSERQPDAYAYANVKRVCDVLSCCLSLPLLCPLFLVLALMIKLDSNGPVF